MSIKDEKIKTPEFTKENLNEYLKELGKEFRKRNGKTTPGEIILIGGAAVLANYGFRDMTTDMDAIISASSAMKEAISAVADKYNLPFDWLNTDFKKTDSYSYKLVEHSSYYKTFANILVIRTVKAEYLIAMKLVAGRIYKKDLSDIIGICMEENEAGNTITYEAIDEAMLELYGGWDKVEPEAIKVLNQALQGENLQYYYDDKREWEKENKEKLIEFGGKPSDLFKEDNFEYVISQAEKIKNQQK